MKKFFIEDEAGMLVFGRKLSQLCKPGITIYLQGPLGAGKTTLVRGILRGLGFSGTIKSPTYTLVENYHVDSLTLFHFDLYRLNRPQELLDIGFEDYLTPSAICLIEWPEKAAEILPKANISCRIVIPADGRGREIMLEEEISQ